MTSRFSTATFGSFGVLVLLGIGFGVPIAHADDTLITKVSAGKIERIINGFKDVKNFKELDNNAYAFEVNNLRIILFNRGDSMQLYAGFNTKATNSRINEWNRDKRYTKAYLNKDNQPVLESDIDIEGGVSQANIEKWMKTFVVSLGVFKKHLED